MKRCPSSIRCRDLNPRPSECESLPITTRPGLPPLLTYLTVELSKITRNELKDLKGCINGQYILGHS